MFGFLTHEKTARRVTILLLVAMLGYGAWLRFHHLGISLHENEISTRELALQSAGYTLRNQPSPLYSLLAGLSLRLGDTEAALRLPSYLAGLALILAAFGLARRVHSRTAGLIAAALVAFSPFPVHHSAVASPFALLMLFATLALWALYAALDRGRARAWLGYAGAALLAMAAHLCVAPALLAMATAAGIHMLLDRRRRGWKRRLGALCLLALCTGTSAGVLIHQRVSPATLLAPVSVGVPSQGGESSAGEVVVEPERPRGAGRATLHTATGRTTYRLTLWDCGEYLKTFFWNNTPWLWPLLLVFAIWGVVDLFWRVPALAAPLAGGLLLGTVPLFFLESDHWYHTRYFSHAYGPVVILVACGIAVLADTVARILTAPRTIPLWRGTTTAPAPRRTVLLRTGAILATAIASVPLMDENYRTYPVDGYLPTGPLVPNHAPTRDWQTLHRFTSRVIRDGDPILYMTPEHEQGGDYTRYYLSRFLPWREEEVRLHEAYGPPSPEGIRAWASAFPFSNLWFVGYQNYGVNEFRPLLEAAGLAQFDLSERNVPRGLRLFFVGAPTRNHITNGNFEGRFKEALPEGVVRTLQDSFNGPASLRIFVEPGEMEGRENWTRMYRTAIAPAEYRLRNAGFEAWEDRRPVGWMVRGSGAVGPSEDGVKSSRCLAIAAADEATLLQQSHSVTTGPGHTVAFQATVKSGTADNLQLVLRYAGPGFQEEARAAHPGNGEWETVKVEAKLPPETNPDSVQVEIWRLPGGDGVALVDNADLRVMDGGAGLDPARTYVLSLAVRTTDLHHKSGAELSPGGRVRLSWVDAAGKQGYTELMRLRRDDDWRTLSATFRPGRDLPADLKALHLEAGIVDGIGSMYIDEVQLEPGTRPTPFTVGIRLPHDEVMPRRELEPHAVKAPW